MARQPFPRPLGVPTAEPDDLLPLGDVLLFNPRLRAKLDLAVQVGDLVATWDGTSVSLALRVPPGVSFPRST